MKKNIALLFVLTTLWQSSIAQERFIDEIFTEVAVTSDVVYGVNGTIFHFWLNNYILPDTLLMDVYQPVGDSETERPVVLVFHDGYFLPPAFNGRIEGTKTDSSCVEICKQLARRGFTTVSVTYRLGWNPLANTGLERAIGLIQAIYRGIQDGRTAIRFLRKTYAEDGNPYRINPDRIVAWGNGTSGYITLGMAGLSDYQEILLTTHTPAKFLFDSDGDNIPDKPMIAEDYHGDIEGKITTIVPDNDYWLMAGDTSNYANHPNYSSEFHLSVNIGGAIADLGWLADNTIPLIAIQHPYDMIAPYDDQLLLFGGTPEPIFHVQGAQKIGEWLESSGINQPWIDLNLQDDVTQEAASNAVTYGDHPYYEGVYTFYQEANSLDIYEGVVINWWNPDDPSPVDSYCMGLPWNECDHPGWTGTFHEYALLTNEDMSSEKAKANIARVMAYVIPRTCVALDLDCAGISAVDEQQRKAPEVMVMPNPSPGFARVETKGNVPPWRVEVYSMDGRLVAAVNVGENPQATFDLHLTIPGMYLVQVYLDTGVVTRKLIVL